jgi:hypothetical protein
MNDILELLDGFDFEADPGEAILDLFVRVMACQATLASLKVITLNNLAEYTNKSTDELDDEFKDIFSDMKNELLVKFISKYGKLSN